MTTVAWDSKTLCADTRGVCNGVPRVVIKAFRLDDGRLFASAGDAQDGIAVRHWLNQGGEKPKVSERFSALIVSPEGCMRMEDGLVPMDIHESYHAIGSGRDFALAAMHMGKTAREAVELAIELDVNTGGDITELSLEPKAEIRLTQGNVFWLSDSGESNPMGIDDWKVMESGT